MSRIRLSAALPALLVVSSLGSGVLWLHGCVPSPDISALPPYDAGVQPAEAGPVLDSSSDSVAPPNDGQASEAAADTGPIEASTLPGTVQGVVSDYTQGAGLGVVPGATVSVLGTSITATSGLDGAFMLANVPAGRVQINVSHPVTPTSSTVYSTTQVVLTLGSAETVTIEPMLHEGCVGFVNMVANGGDASTSSLVAQCGGRQTSGNYAAVTFTDVTSLKDATSGATYQGLARVEMIPLAFPALPAPVNANSIDYTWGAGLPGAATEVDTIAAMEVRVSAADVEDGGGTVPGAALEVATGKTVTLTMPVPSNATSVAGYAPWAYDPLGGTWGADTSGSSLGALGTAPNSVKTVTLTATHLRWWSVTSPAATAEAGAEAPSGCFKGQLTAPGGGPAAGVWVHAIGTDWLGASSAVTDSQGNFCVDAKQSLHVTMRGLSVSTSGLSVLNVTPAGASGIGGSCESNQVACAPIQIALTAAPIGCVGGRLASDAGAPAYDVVVFDAGLTTAQVSAGMENFGILTQASPSGGTVCAPGPEGVPVGLVDPSDSTCALTTNSSNGAESPAPIGAASGPGVCGSTCTDAGVLRYACAPAP